MTRRRFVALTDSRQVSRSICLSVGAIAVLAAAVAFKGWHVFTAIAAGAIVLMVDVMVFQVHKAIMGLRGQWQLVRETAAEAEMHYVEVLWRIVRFAESRDKYLRGHSERVAVLSSEIAKKLQLPDDKVQKLKIAGKLHDLGILALPHKIIDECNQFGIEAFRVMQKHPQISYEVLEPLESLADVLPAIRYHHERMNGTGYPDGLVGEEIPLDARILAVADAYDAMTHDRHNRPAMSTISALDELYRCTPAGYDSICVDALAELKNFARLRELAQDLRV